MMQSVKAAIVTLVLLAFVTSSYTVQSVILRPDWFPYFKEDTGISGSKSRGVRNLPQEQVICPSDMTEYECYHTFMAVWTRLVQKDQQLVGRRDAQHSLLARLTG